MANREQGPKYIGWVEYLGLSIAPIALAPQLGFMTLILSGYFGSSGHSGRLPWAIYAFVITPLMFVQTLVITPVLCLLVLRHDGKPRRIAVIASLAVSAVTLALSYAIVDLQSW